MKIEKFHLAHLRNSEHFQFVVELHKLIAKYGAEALKIEAQFSAFLPLYGAEDEALKKIVKSPITADIQAADKRRDRLFRAMVECNKGALVHFSSEVQAAAKRIKVVLGTYGNVARKPLNEETADIYNLLQDLNGKYAQDVALTGIGAWVQELESANETFSRLVGERYEETALKTDLVLRQCRQKVDEVYYSIVERINALVVVEGGAAYEAFIRNLNAVIEKYNEGLAHRHGKGSGKQEEGEVGSEQ
jgi:hypothetical protein